GDMFELGEREREMHGEIGAYCVEKGIDVIICTGELSRFAYEEACRRRGNADCVYYFRTRDEMMSELPGILRQGDSILVKASHGMRFETVVELLQTGFQKIK
ncbi:MAG: UDP-N-acetylmuramoyl-tripeptide--D-alanyl-D-alanine ligase, partial [Lachnospiraceae bacterium]|nr:UDP-N-acetylmuramoyl-tripeptide--D-alanyl-D-alanine ligase [Lachnospiraceae bacterium]